MRLVNPALERFSIIDYRIYAPDTDSKTKIDHVKDMIKNTVYHKALPFKTVLMDTWYAAMEIWKLLEHLGKPYYCPIKNNRQVSLSPADRYQRVDSLAWPDQQLDEGRLVHLRLTYAGLYGCRGTRAGTFVAVEHLRW